AECNFRRVSMKKLVLVFLLAFPLCELTKYSYAGQGTIQPTPVSPRLVALSKDLGAGNGSALESFWQEVTRQGTPLVETIKGDQENVLVTFLWRSPGATNVVLMCDFGANVRSRVLTRLLSTDVWYKTYQMPNDARFFYQLSVDDPSFPFEGEAETEYPTKFQSDPLNPRQYDFANPNIF